MLFSFFTSWSRYILLVILALICGSFFYFDFNQYLTLDALQQYQSMAQQWTNDHYHLVAMFYMLIFTCLIACSIPCATFFTLLGGFLFDAFAILYAELSITLGGTILYFAIRTTLGTRIAARSTGWIKKFEAGFRENAFNYLLTLRLIPIMPCWVSNIAAGILNVPFRTFVTATALGVLPSTVIYALAGRGLDKILHEENTPIMNIVFTPLVLFPLLGLALFSLFPVIYKWLKKPS